MRILVIEDELKTAAYLRKGLEGAVTLLNWSSKIA
jgi:DNA-binding response OmpR family regulator